MNKRDIVTLSILAGIFVFILLIVLLNWNKEEDIKNKTEFNELVILNDESVFLSVSNSINKICEYSNNNTSLDFILKNEEYNKNKYKNTSFKANEIYVVSKLELYKYYVKGSFYKEVMDQPPTYIEDGYFILNYDMENTSYNIEIINEEKYNNAKDEKYIFEKVNSNNYNRFEYSNLSNKSRALLYFNDFLNKLNYNIEEAYNLLSSDTKNNRFTTIDEFRNFISENKNITMKEYSINNNEIGIKDNYNNEYIFRITYAFKYIVTINKTEE